MAIKSVSGKSAVIAPTNLVSAANKVVPPKLVFHEYSYQYFLAQTWLKYSVEGPELFVSPEELKMAREDGQQTVVLALVRNMGISAVPGGTPRIPPTAQVR